MENDNFAPYAPKSNVINILRQYRNAGLPWPLTNDTITHVGVSEGNAYRTISALEFLNLIDSDGYKTENMEILGKVPEDKYPEELAKILKNAYSYIFFNC